MAVMTVNFGDYESMLVIKVKDNIDFESLGMLKVSSNKYFTTYYKNTKYLKQMPESVEIRSDRFGVLYKSYKNLNSIKKYISMNDYLRDVGMSIVVYHC